MNTTPDGKAIICAAFIIALMIPALLKAQSSSRSATEPESSAVDIKGVRHRPSDYGDKRAPWMSDRLKFVQPNYPAEYESRRAEGTGVFRITLDANTGAVTIRSEKGL